MPRHLTNRRHFLSAAAAGVGFWTFPSPLPAVSPNEKLNLGHIGVGNRGLSNLVELKAENALALCDVDETYLARARQLHPKASVYRDMRKLLEHPKLDGVVVSTPDHTHVIGAAGALEQGLDVYCETPLAHSIGQTRHLAKLAKQQSVITQFGAQHHSSAGHQLASAWLRSGKLGAISAVHAWTNRPIWPQGLPRPKAAEPPAGLDWNLWLGPAPLRPFALGYHPGDWRGFWDFGTGTLGAMGPHFLDPVASGLKLQLPVKITAESSEVTRESAPKWSIVRFDFDRAEGSPPLELTWYDGGKQPGKEITGVDRPPASGAMVLCEHARLFIPEYGRAPIVVPHDRGQKIEPPKLAEDPQATLSHQQRWAAACRTQVDPTCNFAYGALLTEICHLGNLAIRTGTPIAWNAKKMKAIDNEPANLLVQETLRAY